MMRFRIFSHIDDIQSDIIVGNINIKSDLKSNQGREVI